MPNTTPSREDYLEAIFDLSRDSKEVRSIDVATLLGFSRASVSRAISLLKRAGFVNQEPYGTITLTPAGQTLAQSVRRRHNLLKYFLLHIIEVDEKTAEEDACKLEHIVSAQTLRRIEELSTRHMNEFHGGKATDE